MAEETGLVIVSFFTSSYSAGIPGKNKAIPGPAEKSCKNIIDQLKPLQRRGNGFEIWHHDHIKPGSDPEEETKAALARCRVAVLLVSNEFLSSPIWQIEAEPLLAAYREGRIRLLWQQINSCNCDELNQIQPMINGKVLIHERGNERQKHENEISRMIYDEWIDDREVFTNNIKEANIPPTAKPVEKPMPCDAVALLVWLNGRDERGRLCCCWQAWIQKAGESDYRQIPNVLIEAKDYYAKDQLPKLLSLLKRYMGRSLKDVSVLEIFATDELLDEDWGNMSIHPNWGRVSIPPDEDRLLQDDQPYLLRPLSRLINPDLNARREGPLMRMHKHLEQGTGAWLPGSDLTDLRKIRNLDGLSKGRQANVVCAIYCPQVTDPSRRTWLESVTESMAPLVVWPSRHNVQPADQWKSCRSQLPFVRVEATQAGDCERPHCPDLAMLARDRQNWYGTTPDLKALTILVDHPERRPDPQILQQIFSAFPSSNEEPLQPKAYLDITI
jgi:hypothetical protein